MSTGDDWQSAADAMEQTIAEVARGNLRLRVPTTESMPKELKGLAESMNKVIEAWRSSELRSRQIKRALEQKVALVEAQAVAIRELSTPILQVWQGVLLLPIVGEIHEERSVAMTEELLARVVKSGAQKVIIDITGVEHVDERTGDHLVKLVRATRLIGADCVMTGMSPSVAQTFIGMGADLKEVHTLRTLEQGLIACTQ